MEDYSAEGYGYVEDKSKLRNWGNSCSSQTKSNLIKAIVDLSLFKFVLRIELAWKTKGNVFCEEVGGIFPGSRWADISFPHQNYCVYFTNMDVKTAACIITT